LITYDIAVVLLSILSGNEDDYGSKFYMAYITLKDLCDILKYEII